MTVTDTKTHRLVKRPQITARYLAEYMAGSERAKRRVTKRCRYQPIAAVIQHNDAKSIVSQAIHETAIDLAQAAIRVRSRLADSPFERDLLDHNADYIERFAKVHDKIEFPKADLLPSDNSAPYIMLKGVRINVETNFRLRRLTRTNRICVGVGALRYAKGKPLSQTIAEWDSAFLHGYLCKTNVEKGAEPEVNLCVIVDAYAGVCYSAPTDARRRFLNMEAACETIAEHWDNIPPPRNAIL